MYKGKFETMKGKKVVILATNFNGVRPIVVMIDRKRIERLTKDLKFMVTAREPYIRKVK